MGSVIIRCSASTLGFAKVDTTRPSISSNIASVVSSAKAARKSFQNAYRGDGSAESISTAMQRPAARVFDKANDQKITENKAYIKQSGFEARVYGKYAATEL